jgi:hypothetical protein
MIGGLGRDRNVQAILVSAARIDDLSGGNGTIPRKLLPASKISHPYQDLFALWKEAVHNIPVLQEEKAEYARLQ